jgi:hypothetical protein
MAASHALKALPRRAKHFAALCDAAQPTDAATLGVFRLRPGRAGGAGQRRSVAPSPPTSRSKAAQDHFDGAQKARLLVRVYLEPPLNFRRRIPTPRELIQNGRESPSRLFLFICLALGTSRRSDLILADTRTSKSDPSAPLAM